jgi:alkylation response protein AidB-like acyl-CoA dehydrogenase
MYINVEASRAFIYRALRQASRGETDPVFDPLTSAAKYFVVEQAIDTITIALRLVGGRGYLKKNSYERSLRDFMGLISGAGAQDLLQIGLGDLVIRKCARGSERVEEI